MLPRIRSSVAQEFSERPGSAATAVGMAAASALFAFNAAVVLPGLARTGILLAQLCFLLSAAIALVLAVWLWHSPGDGELRQEGVTLAGLGLGAVNILLTEGLWPDAGIGPFGYLLILNCMSGAMLRSPVGLGGFLLVFNVAWIAVDQLTDGPIFLGTAQLSIQLISALFGAVFFLLLRNDRNVQRRLTRELADQVRIDALTGVLSRRGLFEELGDSGCPADPPAWCASVDIDFFKQINDRFGHAHGDRVLTTVGRTLVETTGPQAVAARWGGDEFVVIGRGPVPAEDTLEGALNRQLAASPTPCRVTVGVAPAEQERLPRIDPEPDGRDRPVDRLIRLADQRMYERRRATRGTDGPERHETVAREAGFTD